MPSFKGYRLQTSIVGYTAKDADQGKFIIIGAQFEGVTDGSMKINGLVNGLTGVDYDSDGIWLTTAAQIQVPATTGGYTTYRYLNDGWYDDDGNDAYKSGWCDAGGNIVDDEFTLCVAHWLKSVQDSVSANVAGAVSEDSSADISCPVGFALRAGAFPIGITLNTAAMTAAGITGVDYDSDGTWLTTAPQIQVPATTGGYTTYRYLNDGWYDDDGNDAYKSGWCDAGGNIVSDVIPAAQGFWTKGVQGAFTLTFTK